MKIPPFKKRLRHLRKTAAVVMAVQKAIKVNGNELFGSLDECLYDVAFEEGFRAACTVASTPIRDDEELPEPNDDLTPMQFAKLVGDYMLVNYYKRVIQ